jgi:hypothetical protein
MKQFLIILMSLLVLNTSAQLVVKEAAKDTVVWQTKGGVVPKLIKFSSEAIETYTMYFRNAKYTSITDIDYITIGDYETTKQFFKLLETVITEDKEYNIDLGKKSIILKKSMGSSVMIWTTSSYFYLNTKEISGILEKL